MAPEQLYRVIICQISLSACLCPHVTTKTQQLLILHIEVCLKVLGSTTAYVRNVVLSLLQLQRELCEV